MIWGPGAIAGFGDAAGWSGDELVQAVAVALAASGGDDLHTSRPFLGSAELLVGLWQVPAFASDGDTWQVLLDPYVNANAAQALYTAAGGSWAWSPGWQSGRWRQWREIAAQTVTSDVRADTLISPGTRLAT